MKQETLQVILPILRNWAHRPDAATDLREIFGAESRQSSPLIDQIRNGDLSWIPTVEVLPSTVIKQAYGAYARETGTIYLASDCPADRIPSVLLEEIGHHIDAQFNATETPGDEGALFSAAVQGITLSDEEITAILNEDDSSVLSLHGRQIAVECASRVPIPTTSRKPTTPATRKPIAPVVTVKPGAKGNTTQSGDWVTSDVDYTLIDAPTKRGLNLVGGGNLIGTGNSGGTTRQNTLTAASNSGNTTLIAGTASTTMIGGFGDNLLDARGSQGTVSIRGGSGSSTMLAANGLATLVGGGKNNSLVAGTATTRTLGQSLVGGTSTSSLFGNTLRGGSGRDTLRSGEGFNTLFSGSGAGQSNTLIGGGNSNSLVAGRGNDSLAAVSGNSTLLGGTGRSTLLGGAAGSNNWLQSGSTGTGGNTLIGGAGSNTLVAGPTGSDSVVGGANQNLLLVTQANRNSIGNDTINLSTLASARNTLGVSLSAGISFVDSLISGTFRGTARNLSRVENVASVAARIELGSNAEAVGVRTLASGTTNDTLSAAGYQNASVLLDGSRAASRISMVGGARNDTLIGSRGGVDTLIGGAGNDSLSLQNASISLMSLDGGADTDTLRFNTASLTLQGASFSRIRNFENLALSSGSNLVGSLQGSGINNILGGTGSDTLSANLVANVKTRTEANSTTLRLLMPAGVTDAMGFASGQVISGNGIRLGTRISNIVVDGSSANRTITLTLDTATSAAIAAGSVITGFLNAATLNGGTNANTNGKGDYLLSGGSENLLIGSQTDSNTLVSGIYDSNTLSGGSGRNLYILNNKVGWDNTLAGENLPWILNRSGIQSASTLQFTGDAIKLSDEAFAGLATGSAQVITTANGNNRIQLGELARPIGIQTIIGGLGSDTFVTGLQLGDPISMTLTADALLGDLVIYVNDTSELSIGSLVTGEGISESTTILDIDSDSGAVTLSDGITQDLLVDSALSGTPLTPYVPSVYFDASRGSGNQSLSAGLGNDTLLAGTGNATLEGGDGNNSLRGGLGNNSIHSGVGNSTLDGGGGISTLQAEGGENLFIVRTRLTRILAPTSDEFGTPLSETPLVGKVETYVNFDPLQSTQVDQFAPTLPDGSPSIAKTSSFASLDLSGFYNLREFTLKGSANYGVGNALDNILSVESANALLLGMGGNNTLIASGAKSSLYGNISNSYSNPDLYAYAPVDTKTKEFVDGVIGIAGNNYLEAKGANSYLDGGEGYNDGYFGSGSNTLAGTGGNSTLIQRHQADSIKAGGSGNTLFTSVDLYRLPDNVSDLVVLVTPQATNSGQITEEGQRMTAGYVAVNEATGGYTGTNSIRIASAPGVTLEGGSLKMQVHYGSADGTSYGSAGVDADLGLDVGDPSPDPKDPANKNAVTLSWTVPTSPGGALNTQTTGYLVKYRCLDEEGNALTPWLTYLSGSSQDLGGSSVNPSLLVDNLPNSVKDSTGTGRDVTSYDFQVTAQETVLPAVTDMDPASPTFGQLIARPVSLIGGGGLDGNGSEVILGEYLNDVGTNLSKVREVLINNPTGTIETPAPWSLTSGRNFSFFPTYQDGKGGNDLLVAPYINDASGSDFTAYQNFQGVPTAVTFSGLNTLVGGTGSDTFVVSNGGTTLDTLNGIVTTGAYDQVIEFAPSAGEENLIISDIEYLTLSDTDISQGKFISQAWTSGNSAFGGQYLAGNRLDNTLTGYGSTDILMGGVGRDFITGRGLLIGGSAYGLDSIAGAMLDYYGVTPDNNLGAGGTGFTPRNPLRQKDSIYRDTDPVPPGVNGPGSADLSQYWLNGNGQYDPMRNSDTLVGSGTLDGGAGADSMVGGAGNDDFYVSGAGDTIRGGGGNDTAVFTGSDIFWSGLPDSTTTPLSYGINPSISNLKLQDGSPIARIGTGNSTSTGNQSGSNLGRETGSNKIVGNEYDNILDGGGVGVGVDTLEGGEGSNTFVITSYIGSERNASAKYSNPNILVATYNITQYATDADYAYISDFNETDKLDLVGDNSSYLIGSAPSGFSLNNIKGGDALTDSSTTFGIYFAPDTSTPNLVAVINCVGGMRLGENLAYQSFGGINVDGTNGNLGGEALTPGLPSGNVTGLNYLGVGAMYKLDGSDFGNKVI